MSRTFPGAITAIFSILKPRMSAENAPVFAMFVRLQNKQNEPRGVHEVFSSTPSGPQCTECKPG